MIAVKTVTKSNGKQICIQSFYALITSNSNKLSSRLRVFGEIKVNFISIFQQFIGTLQATIAKSND